MREFVYLLYMPVGLGGPLKPAGAQQRQLGTRQDQQISPKEEAKPAKSVEKRVRFSFPYMPDLELSHAMQAKCDVTHNPITYPRHGEPSCVEYANDWAWSESVVVE